MGIIIDIDTSKIFDDFKEHLDDIERLYKLVPYHSHIEADLIMDHIKKRMRTWITAKPGE